jgi:Predicted ATPase related to phosphate starvation-inducible protein PhoH
MTKKLFVLDTNVLMHDPSCLFRFEEHDLFIPMVVLEELDAAKKGTSEVSRNVRQVSRYFDDLIHGREQAEIEAGLELPSAMLQGNGNGNTPAPASPAAGRLYFQTRPTATQLPDMLPGGKPDNSILLCTLELQNQHPHRSVVLVSKDINLRIKASIIGVRTEDYHNDQVLEDLDLLYRGYDRLPADFWETHGEQMESWQDARGAPVTASPAPARTTGTSTSFSTCRMRKTAASN